MAASALRQIVLGKDVVMPSLGFGAGTAWFKAEGDKPAELKRAIKAALDAGFRHIDDAEMYQNTAVVGAAVNEWLAANVESCTRKDLFITNKVFRVEDPGPKAVCRENLKAAGLEYYDLFLVHSPFKFSGERFERPMTEVWAEMESLVDDGLVRTIGVSNFQVEDLEGIWATARIKPVMNQIESHTYLQQTAVLEWCKAHGVATSAYGSLVPLTRPELVGGPVDAPVKAAAERLGCSTSEILLRWALQRGGVITTTGKPERLPGVLKTPDLAITDAEIAEISTAGKAKQYRAFWKFLPPA